MARLSFMTTDVATPPTTGWQALASNFASDSATLISRLLLLFIFIAIAGFGLHLNYVRNRSSVAAPTSSSSTTRPPSATDGMLLCAKLVPWGQSKLAFLTGLIWVILLANHCRRDLQTHPSSVHWNQRWLTVLNNPCILMGRNYRHRRTATGRDPDDQFAWCSCHRP